VRLGLDATPLLGARTGVGRHVAGLLSGLAELGEPEELVLTAFTWRGAGPLAEFSRTGTRQGRRAPARPLRLAWRHARRPAVEWFTGPVDVFHATNFVLPPTRSAAGVVTVHDLAFLDHGDTVARASRAYRVLVPRGLARARAVCAPTRTVATALTDRFSLDPGRVVVTPNGLSRPWLDDPRPASAAWLAAHGLPERYLLFVGTPEPRKNLPWLLSAHRELADAPPLVLVGPAGWGPSPHGDRVVRAGYLDEADLVGVVAAASALVLPSRDEGFGIPPLEALACGVPVVVSDLPALREVLAGQARYVPLGDTDALVRALAETLAADQTIGAPARRGHARGYTWRRCAEAALRAYRVATGGADG